MENRVALVTGAAMGQGADAARLFAQLGYCVGMLDIQERALLETAAQLSECSANVLPLVADIADRGSVQAAVDQLVHVYGPIWAVASAAGILPLGGFCVDTDEHSFNRVMEVNFLGVANVAITAAKSMIAAGKGGRIVNWSSVNAVVASPGFSPYAASKAAVEMFSRTLALELAPHQITVNCLRPGSIVTPMMFDMTEQDFEQESRRIPLGRWGTVKDTSAVLRFLVSDDASWITGNAITVDGGATASSGGMDQEAIQRRIDNRRQAKAFSSNRRGQMAD